MPLEVDTDPEPWGGWAPAAAEVFGCCDVIMADVGCDMADIGLCPAMGVGENADEPLIWSETLKCLSISFLRDFDL